MTVVDRGSDAERYEVVSGGFNMHLFAAAAIRPAHKVLDVGCGYGGTTRLAAVRAPDGHVVGNDIAEPLLAHAKAAAQAQGLRNITFEEGDAQTHPFPAGGFDVAISRFGVMFFADPVAAFANLGRALRPRGRLVFTTIGPPETNDLPTIVSAVAPAAGVVHSLSDPDRVREVLGDAGFVNVQIRAVETAIELGASAEEAGDFIARWGAFGDPDARAALTEAARPYEREGAVRLRSTAWLVTGVRL
ncbi:methyltransferase domain-containing protein [Actinomadura barringtoniae]|uniref:Methyltransferase domain-containing protein n=1 Tax=Actinomadura barringtoniae TaxID=1427535 RepID=A0A939PIY7_9ACTN|nr:methyltransferase domain-containing protein [Actinomadura barringtoniae]MBO2449416.1 methyltransferase domain-containing protein [Actinomadura barringtoniae]